MNSVKTKGEIPEAIFILILGLCCAFAAWVICSAFGPLMGVPVAAVGIVLVLMFGGKFS